MSGGGEGELPIVKENVFLHAYYGYKMPFVNFDRINTSGNRISKKFEVYKIYGSNFSGIKFKLDEFTDAVAGIRACFRITKGKQGIKDKIELKCTNEKLDAYKNKSKLN